MSKSPAQDQRQEILSRITHEATYEWNLMANRLEWSGGMETVFGHSKKDIGEGLDWWSACLHPDDHDRVQKGLVEAIEGSKTESWETEYHFRKGDGEYACVLDRGFFLRNEAGVAERMIGSMVDITEQKAHENELKRLVSQLQNERSRLRDLFDNVPGIVWEIQGRLDTGEGQISFMSDYAESILGYPVSELMGDPSRWWDLFHPEDRERIAERIRKNYTGEYQPHPLLRMITRDGRTIWIESRWVVTRDAEGNSVGMRGVTTDVTERVKAEKEREQLLADLKVALEKAQLGVRIRDDFLAIASHELKTPITSVQLQSQSLLRLNSTGKLQETSPEVLTKMLEIGDQQARRLAVLVGELLDVSALAVGHLKMDQEIFDLCELLAEVVNRLQAAGLESAKQISLSAQSPLIGHWDRSRMDQVFTNLLSNALKYGTEKPVLVEARRENDHAVVAVSDHGIGMNPEDVPRIFDRFERATSSRHFGGFGLGLYITREIVRAHGGSIEVKTMLGKGSTFTARLPISL